MRRMVSNERCLWKTTKTWEIDLQLLLKVSGLQSIVREVESLQGHSDDVMWKHYQIVRMILKISQDGGYLIGDLRTSDHGLPLWLDVEISAWGLPATETLSLRPVWVKIERNLWFSVLRQNFDFGGTLFSQLLQISNMPYIWDSKVSLRSDNSSITAQVKKDLKLALTMD